MSSFTADTAIGPPGINTSTQDIEMKVETASDQPSNLGKRRAGVRARENLASIAAAASDDDVYAESDDEEPSKKKIKNAVTKPAEKWGRGRIVEKGTRIGVHKLGDDEVSVYATYYRNGTLNCRVYREEVDPEIELRHKAFFTAKAQITMAKITFDMGIFNTIGAHDIQSLTDEEEQKNHIRTYLATLGTFPRYRGAPVPFSQAPIVNAGASSSNAPAVSASASKTSRDISIASTAASSSDAPSALTDISAANKTTKNPSTANATVSSSKTPSATTSLGLSNANLALSSSKAPATSSQVPASRSINDPSSTKPTSSKTLATADEVSATNESTTGPALTNGAPSKTARSYAASMISGIPANHLAAIAPPDTRPGRLGLDRSMSSQSTATNGARASEKPSSESTTSTVDFSLDLNIGSWESESTVAVYAFLKASALCFRVHMSELDKATCDLGGFTPQRTAVKFEAIEFKAQFMKENDAATKAALKSLCEARKTTKMRQEPPMEVEDSGSDDDDDEGIPGLPIPAYVNAIRHREATPPKERQAREARKTAAVRAGQREAKKFFKRNTLGQIDCSAEREESINGEGNKMQEGATAGHARITRASNVATSPAAATDSPTESEDDKDAIIRKQTKTIRAQEKKIVELQDQLRRLIEAGPNAVLQAVTNIAKTAVGRVVYDILGSGPNAGKLLTKEYQRVNINGKAYKEWTALSEIKLHMGNTGEMVEVRRMGGWDFYKVPDGEQRDKWVQAVSEQSLLEVPEGKFIRWVIREEIEDEDFII